jgi:hypothetical protein
MPLLRLLPQPQLSCVLVLIRAPHAFFFLRLHRPSHRRPELGWQEKRLLHLHRWTLQRWPLRRQPRLKHMPHSVQEQMEEHAQSCPSAPLLQLMVSCARPVGLFVVAESFLSARAVTLVFRVYFLSARAVTLVFDYVTVVDSLVAATFGL